MIVAPFGNNLRKDADPGKPPGTSHPAFSLGQSGGGASLAPPNIPSSSIGGPQNPNVIYQHIHDIAPKRISTLDYLRKA